MQNIRGALLAAGGLGASLFVASAAPAQAHAPDPSIEIVLATRGMSKGLAQTDGAQLLVRPELGLGDFFVAAYGKNVVSSNDQGIEAGILAGARFGLDGFQLGGSVALKRLAGIGGAVDDDALEVVLSASRAFGRVTPRLSATWSPNELGSTRHSLYLEAGLSFSLGHGTTLSGNVARRERSGGADYTAFNLGVSQTLVGGISADIRFYDTAQSAFGEIYRARVVGSLRVRF